MGLNRLSESMRVGQAAAVSKGTESTEHVVKDLDEAQTGRGQYSYGIGRQEHDG